MRACDSCGQGNPAGTQFCSSCGEYLGWTAAPAPAAPSRSFEELSAPDDAEREAAAREQAARVEGERAAREAAARLAREQEAAAAREDEAREQASREAAAHAAREEEARVAREEEARVAREEEAARAEREAGAREEAARLAGKQQEAAARAEAAHEEEAARVAREEEEARAERERLARAEREAAARTAREEAARLAREEEAAARLAREQEAAAALEAAARVAREAEAARVAREAEAARVAREEEAARAEREADAARVARELAARAEREAAARAAREEARAAAREEEAREQAAREEAAEAGEEKPERAGALGAALGTLEEGKRLAQELDRPDIGEQLELTKARLSGQVYAVAVVGEFKRGKSTLVNATLQTDLCPVDADIVTAVPTVVRYGLPASATAMFAPEDDPAGDVVEEAVDVDRLWDLVGEDVDQRRRARLRSVEVRIGHRLLRTGLCLVDTPGVGGLESPHGVATLGALATAEGVLFVTDASQELTAPEMAFLRSAVERCPRAAVVVTKTDLYPRWRRIVDLDRAHLQEHGLDLPVIPVSSFLRLRAWRDPDLDEESGFAPLFDWMRESIVEHATQQAAAVAARDLAFAQQQLDAEVAAEQRILEEPATAEIVVQELEAKKERTGRLLAAGAGWQQALSDGVQDLVADVEHDLQERLRLLVKEAEGIIDQGDPRDAWSTTETWLRRQIVTATTANYDLMSDRAEQLAADLAFTFAMESGDLPDVDPEVPTDLLRDVKAAEIEMEAPGGQRIARMVFAGRTAVLVPALVFSIPTGGVLLLAVAGPLALALGAGIGRKILRDEKQRQLLYRRQQAKIAARRYLDEVAFVVNKECRDALRRTQRELRDEFQARAAVLHKSSDRALESARRAAAMPEPERAARADHLAGRRRELAALGATR